MDKTPILDYKPLDQKVTASDLKSVSKLPYFFLAGVENLRAALLTLGSIFILLLLAQVGPDSMAISAWILLSPLFIGTVLLIFLWSHVNNLRTTVKLTRFATANNLQYDRDLNSPYLNGMIFDEGDSRRTPHRLSGLLNGTVFELGNYIYETGSGKSRQTHEYGYIQVRLSRHLPHMVLDAKQNNFFKISNLPDSFSGGQKLELEGDFSEHFTLYCPKEYERDALYVFTPDLMALLIDQAGAFDVEVVDNRLYIYQEGPFKLTEPGQMERLFRIIDKIGSKMERRTDYYADERVGDRTLNVVAPPGKRLKKTLSIQGVVVFLVIAYVIFTVF
jgi:hypothetical protein